MVTWYSDNIDIAPVIPLGSYSYNTTRSLSSREVVSIGNYKYDTSIELNSSESIIINMSCVSHEYASPFHYVSSEVGTYSPKSIVVTCSESIYPYSGALASDFKLTVNGSEAVISFAQFFREPLFILHLVDDILEGDVVRISYNANSEYKVENTEHKPLDLFSNKNVTNNVTQFEYVSSEVGAEGYAQIYITFNTDMDQGGLPDVEDFSINFTGEPVSIEGYMIFPDSVMLHLSRNILYGETGTVSYSYNSNKSYRLRSDSHFTIKEFSNKPVTNNRAAPITSYILAGTSPSGLILKSTDNGDTFTNEGSAGYGNPTCFYQRANGDILYGTDTGYVINHTKKTYKFLSANKITDIVENDSSASVIFVSNVIGVIYYSSTDVADFTLLYDMSVQINKLAWTNGGFYQFTATGIYLTMVSLIQAGDFKSYCDVGGGVLYAGDASGHIWESVNYGENWDDIAAPISAAGNAILDIASIGSGRYAFVSGIFSSCGMHITDDSFATVSQKIGGSRDCRPSICKISETVSIVPTGSGAVTLANIWRTENNGDLWSQIGGGPNQGESSINCLIKIN